PATASSTTCSTGADGNCSLTAMWDGDAEGFTDPDAVTLFPPPGYSVTGVSGCAAGSGVAPGFLCQLAPVDFSSPLTVTFDLEPYPVLNVTFAGRAEPACAQSFCASDGPFYDDDAVDGTTASVRPLGATAADLGPVAGASCQVQGGEAGGSPAG